VAIVARDVFVPTLQPGAGFVVVKIPQLPVARVMTSFALLAESEFVGVLFFVT